MLHFLQPFEAPPRPITLEAEWKLHQTNNQTHLSLIYRLRGALNEIHLPVEPLLSSQSRAHELWKDTCFEWFLKTNSKTQYWEFNIAPTGQWNFYELSDYRSNLQESPLISACQLRSEVHSIPTSKNHSDNSVHEASQLDEKGFGVYSLYFNASLHSFFNQPTEIQCQWSMALTAVIRWKSGQTSYYSLQHPKDKPDFHHPAGFQVSLP